MSMNKKKINKNNKDTKPNKFRKVLAQFQIKRTLAAELLGISKESVTVMGDGNYRITREKQEEKIVRLLKEYDNWLYKQRGKVSDYLESKTWIY